MKKICLITILSLLSLSSNGQTEQELTACRDSILSYMKAVTRVVAADNSIACDVYDIYNTAFRENKLQEAKELIKSSQAVKKAENVCDSMYNSVKVYYDNIPAIYVMDKEMCDLVNELRLAAAEFHTIVFGKCIYDADMKYINEAADKYNAIDKMSDEIIKKAFRQ